MGLDDAGRGVSVPSSSGVRLAILYDGKEKKKKDEIRSIWKHSQTRYLEDFPKAMCHNFEKNGGSRLSGTPHGLHRNGVQNKIEV
jgi:hypothetical protein